jgi:UDP-N-acetylglucosamine--N-acetylmuramyl-(pentapeptide) pyrophosphoryl-undecaprenol N-acetylglucosamine transferase
MSQKNKKIFLVGGGTGGHAGPILAIYQQLCKEVSSENIFVVGAGTAPEKEFFETIKNYKVVTSGKMNRYLTFKNLIELSKLIAGFCASLQLLSRERPAVIFAKGGYSSLPVVLAAKVLRIPYFIHESDIEMGWTNKMLARGAIKTFVSFPEKYFTKIGGKIEQSGPIFRDSFYEDNTFGFDFPDRDKPILLVSGGSQGSLALTNYFITSAKEVLENFNVILQAGKHSILPARELYESLDSDHQAGLKVFEFLEATPGNDQMTKALRSSSIVLLRAGSTLAEAALLQKPMILVPWKHAASDHQTKNAQFMKESQAAVVITDDELMTKPLDQVLRELMADQAKLNRLAENASTLFPKDGREKIAKNILEIIG